MQLDTSRALTCNNPLETTTNFCNSTTPLHDHDKTLGYNSVFKKDLFKDEVILVTGGGTGKNNQLHTFSLVLENKKNNLRPKLKYFKNGNSMCHGIFLISVPDLPIDRYNHFTSILTLLLCALLVLSLGIGRCIAHELAR